MAQKGYNPTPGMLMRSLAKIAFAVLRTHKPGKLTDITKVSIKRMNRISPFVLQIIPKPRQQFFLLQSQNLIAQN
jgi:hypothetical protein